MCVRSRGQLYTKRKIRYEVYSRVTVGAQITHNKEFIYKVFWKIFREELKEWRKIVRSN
jgi:hypothetical protein